jgi:hypothetical protein
MNRNGVIRNSIVVSPSDQDEAIFTHAANDFETGTFRNVTAIATGNSGVGIRVRASSQGAVANVLVKNAIAHGGPGGDDIRAETDNTAKATITVGSSNFADSETWLAGASIADAGGNQTAPPAFVDAVSGNYHEAPGSPTLGARGWTSSPTARSTSTATPVSCSASTSAPTSSSSARRPGPGPPPR